MIKTPAPVKVRSWRMDTAVWQVYDSPSELGVRKLREFLKPYNMTVARRKKKPSRYVIITRLNFDKPVPKNWGEIADWMFEPLIEHKLYDTFVAWAPLNETK